MLKAQPKINPAAIDLLARWFNRGYFISISNGRLSVVGFTDVKKHVLSFLPDEENGKDVLEDSTVITPSVRKYAARWLKAYGLSEASNITIVRGIDPTKPIDP